MKKFFLHTFILFISLHGFAQGIKIKGYVKDMPYSKVYFAEILRAGIPGTRFLLFF